VNSTVGDLVIAVVLSRASSHVLHSVPDISRREDELRTPTTVRREDY
jgi:hypothetical protein